MRLLFRIAKLEAVTPTGGCGTCTGREVWLSEELPESCLPKDRPGIICPRCGAYRGVAKVLGIDRATWEAL